MTAYRRPFTATPHGDGLLILAGNRYVRLNADEVADLTDHLAAPVVEREVARLVGLEA